MKRKLEVNINARFVAKLGVILFPIALVCLGWFFDRGNLRGAIVSAAATIMSMAAIIFYVVKDNP